MSIEIDLRPMREPFLEAAREAIQEFAANRPGAEISAVGFAIDGYNGDIDLHLDTPEHSDAYVQNSREDDGDENWPGSDAHGLYCSNCWDFAHHLLHCGLEDYPDLDTIAESEVIFIGLDGAPVPVEFGTDDAAFHRALLPLASDVAQALYPFEPLKKASPFRILCQLGEEAAKPIDVV